MCIFGADMRHGIILLIYRSKITILAPEYPRYNSQLVEIKFFEISCFEIPQNWLKLHSPCESRLHSSPKNVGLVNSRNVCLNCKIYTLCNTWHILNFRIRISDPDFLKPRMKPRWIQASIISLGAKVNYAWDELFRSNFGGGGMLFININVGLNGGTIY